MKNPLLILALIATAVVSAGCASSKAGDVYSRAEARRPISYREGTLLEVRKVRLEGTKSGLGALGGAAIGGVAGSGIGDGRGAIVAGIVGAVVGGVAGAATEEGYTRENAWELTVRMTSGETMVVVQGIGKEDKFAPGDHVRVLQSSGETRVSPATAPLAPAPAPSPAKDSKGSTTSL
ncbi:outer membrane lipoprotein [Uliginosibacterium aquaticum]|uniref:outer membrane lipoprotein n=1 Tax=Uliginosibacterium aquaticum TaxID=2731212 RepID=UPI001C2D561A|nr:hypothetical protein [Uliginosibacterium aquaticum]